MTHSLLILFFSILLINTPIHALQKKQTASLLWYGCFAYQDLKIRNPVLEFFHRKVPHSSPA